MLPELLTQLAQLYRANETIISADQIMRWKECLSASDVSALHRLFSLFLLQVEHNPTIATPSNPSTTNQNNGLAVVATGAASAQPSQLRVRHCRPSATSTADGDHQQESYEHQQVVSSVSEGDVFQKDLFMGIPNPGYPRNSSQCMPSSNVDTTTATPSLTTRATTPLQGVTDDDSFFRTPSLSPSMKLLLESCRTDRGVFLREIGKSRAVLPTGQGWEAAIAAKVDNADLRDRMKIYHRFECYNIYQHVVEAGYHTGTYWIRDMRTNLAKKLCEKFPQRFRDQQAANKSLNWVDQGCKYHEWAGQFKRGITDLGYLIALPLDVPHSAYTSRCTKKRMHEVANDLKSRGIESLVTQYELTELGNHIAVTLRDMTCREHREAPGDTPQGSCKSPRSMPSLSELSSHILTVHSAQTPTPPESLIANLYTIDCPSRGVEMGIEMEMEYPVNYRSTDHYASAYACRSIAADSGVPANGLLGSSMPILHTPFQTIDMGQAAYLTPSTSAVNNDALGPLNGWDESTNYTESLTPYGTT
ncbi:hypothetical protein AFCA_006165 [Aspergillus flavus]|nr:hypothetical protein CA14_003641 [Aspergillus flavus]UDD58735.1 hypothetical protein AFCA_006165 [Aspergillus flavus]